MTRTSLRKNDARSVWIGQRSLSDVHEEFGAFGRLLRRKAIVLALWTAAWAAGGLVYAKTLRPEYVATTQVLLQPRQVINDGPEDVRHFHQFLIDSEQCETELRVIQSEQMLYPVLTALGLAQSPEITGGPNGLMSYIAHQLNRFDRDPSTVAAGVAAYYAFADRVRARRLGLSYVIEISYRAHSGEQAARVVNSIAAAYVAYRLRGVIARDRLRGPYLESRSKALDAQIMSADAGMRRGVIPEAAMLDADVSVLGPASPPFARSYPKTGPLVLSMAGLGAVSGLVILLAFLDARRAAPSAARGAELAFSTVRPSKAGDKFA